MRADAGQAGAAMLEGLRAGRGRRAARRRPAAGGARHGARRGRRSRADALPYRQPRHRRARHRARRAQGGARGETLAMVWVDETRPLLQGARLTAWELGRAAVPYTLVTDSSAGLLMVRGLVDAVFVGADRIAANGDVANKIGTYSLAVLARHHGVPFYVVAPRSTFDPQTASGEDIVLEERDQAEVAAFAGAQAAPDGAPALNMAFDVTPAGLVSAIVTEVGALRAPYERSISAALGPAGDDAEREHAIGSLHRQQPPRPPPPNTTTSASRPARRPRSTRPPPRLASRRARRPPSTRPPPGRSPPSAACSTRAAGCRGPAATSARCSSASRCCWRSPRAAWTRGGSRPRISSRSAPRARW